MPITLNISTIYIYFTREGVLKTLKRLEERMINGQDMGPCFNKRDESRIQIGSGLQQKNLKGTVVNRKTTIKKSIYSVNIVSYAKFSEECIDNPNTMSKGEPIVCHNSFDLMELRQMGRVQGLVSEHAICSQHHQIINKYSDNQKTMEQEDDSIAILKCI